MIQRRRRAAHALFIASTMFGPLSCNRSTGERAVHPVDGQLSFEGKPAPGALVFLHPVGDRDPQAPRPRGRVDRDGHFTLTTYRENDGAATGQYVITIDWRKEVPGRGPVGPSLLPRTYGTPQESPLRVTIEAGTNHLPPITIP